MVYLLNFNYKPRGLNAGRRIKKLQQEAEEAAIRKAEEEANRKAEEEARKKEEQ